MKLPLPLLAILSACGALAETPKPAEDTFSVKGKFQVMVEDEVRIYVNGKRFYAQTVSSGDSRETTLKPGDRIIFQLKNTRVIGIDGKRYLHVVFTASDHSLVVRFPSSALKILPDREAADISEAQLARLPKFAVEVHPEHYREQPDFVWGESEATALGTVLKREMFKPTEAH